MAGGGLRTDAAKLLTMSVKQIEEAIVQLPSSDFAELWAWMEAQRRDAESERETAYLLDNPAMRARLLAARASTESVSLEDALKGADFSIN